MKKVLVAVAGVIVVAGASAGLYRYAFTPAEPPVPAIPASSQEASGFALLEKPRALPPLQFVNSEGRETTLADFRGKVVLLNIWATWCVPCREEMPTLDRLQATLGGTGFEVVALSIDHSGLPGVRSFYSEIGIHDLAVYVDTSGKVSRDLNIIGLPTTLLIDREGRELGRKIGPVKWDDPEVMSVIKRTVVPPPPQQSGSGPVADRLINAADAGANQADVNRAAASNGLTFY